MTMKTTTVATAFILSLCSSAATAAPHNAQTQAVLDLMINDPATAYSIGLLSNTADMCAPWYEFRDTAMERMIKDVLDDYGYVFEALEGRHPEAFAQFYAGTGVMPDAYRASRSITADRAVAKEIACAVVIEVSTNLHEHLRAK
jgi:hypothetical protein